MRPCNLSISIISNHTYFQGGETTCL